MLPVHPELIVERPMHVVKQQVTMLLFFFSLVTKFPYQNNQDTLNQADYTGLLFVWPLGAHWNHPYKNKLNILLVLCNAHTS